MVLCLVLKSDRLACLSNTVMENFEKCISGAWISRLSTRGKLVCDDTESRKNHIQPYSLETVVTREQVHWMLELVAGPSDWAWQIHYLNQQKTMWVIIWFCSDFPCWHLWGKKPSWLQERYATSEQSHLLQTYNNIWVLNAKACMGVWHKCECRLVSWWLPDKAENARGREAPAPVAAVCPSGDMARYTARLVCPLREPILVKLVAFHKCKALSAYPWVLSNSFTDSDQARPHIWLPVCTLCTMEPLTVFHSLQYVSRVTQRGFAVHASALTWTCAGYFVQWAINQLYWQFQSVDPDVIRELFFEFCCVSFRCAFRAACSMMYVWLPSSGWTTTWRFDWLFELTDQMTDWMIAR